jgi:hypothetical protein
MNEYLQTVANQFDLAQIFIANRQRELPFRNYLHNLLNVDDDTAIGIEVPYNRTDEVNGHRAIDLVVGNDFYQLGHYTLAQYGNNARPINDKILTEQNVFASIMGNLPPEHNRFLIYITTDIIDCPEITDQNVEQFPLLRYFKNANYHLTRDTKLQTRNDEINELNGRQDIIYLGAFERANPMVIGNRFNLNVYIDFFQI